MKKVICFISGIIYILAKWILYFELLNSQIITDALRGLYILSFAALLIVPLLLIRETIVTRNCTCLRKYWLLVIVYFGILAFTFYCNSFSYRIFHKVMTSEKYIEDGNYVVVFKYSTDTENMTESRITMRCPKQTYELLYQGVTLIGAGCLDNGDGTAVLKDFAGVVYEVSEENA
ncbi:hypothetical protein MCG98_15395 [Ruminococcus sp. OA3]|uniref:hypothetical protein n=1 Tax=Ruminococcus sp. OA3 TaxID=2914164 RepID=UPI001F065D24|nr:hypothetical protein [Ruminococcus sp. OA3]MCH1983954.1 hypothetical protein [Ruminococcus sp. OA3]